MALVCLWLAACASAPHRAQPPEFLFEDRLFAPPSSQVRADDVFTLSEAMKRYLATELKTPLRKLGLQQGLIRALYQSDQLKLQYDPSMTRNAAQAFDARAGNCLSLVIMTAAFAKELGLQIQYHSAYLEETWGRSGDLLVRSGHVNVTLDRRLEDIGRGSGATLTIDFLPPETIRGLRVHDVPEKMIVAMYLNNKAVEALVEGALDDAYAWARHAIVQNPDFVSAYNTLGVIYLRRGSLAQAERVFDHVLALEPAHTRAMANLAQVLARQGRDADSAAVLRRLAQIEPVAPFHYFNLGMAAMQRKDFQQARDLFAQEVARADYQAEFHFWLALASYHLGELEPARKHLSLAVENSVSRREHDLYSAKLAWLKQNAK
jgi:Flp pilus assembly protein TadD